MSVYAINFRSEVTVINKQKFLAELGRLLTFMYEEDRQLALGMYEQMFDSCSNNQGLMQVLVSPTRQAVNIARAYNANDRKLQFLSADSNDEAEDEGNTPDFVLAINDIFQTLSAKCLLDEEESGPVVLENQISFFDEDVDFEEEAEEAVEEEIVLAEELPPVNDDLSAKEEAPVSEEEPVEEAEEECSPADAVDAFLASFAIDESQLVPTQAEEAPAEEAEEEVQPVEEEPVAAEEAVEEVTEEQTELELDESVEDAPVVAATVRKPRVFLLILYSLFAIPVTLAGVVLLLIPTLLVLVLACGVILTGSAIFAAAFSGFAVTADLMVVLGSALVVLAVGLILLWLFVWLVGGAIIGLIKAIVRLGSKCCFKEVAAE